MAVLVSQEDIDTWFAPPTPEQAAAYDNILHDAKILAETINRHLPDSYAKADILHSIRDAVRQSVLVLHQE